ncbi:NADH dehydrogenase [ubiquinone] 1 alpha subcomplex subunit 6-like [Tubulanus polymorphus]|uniref:NADH dehydrogenase [ubiquinone] 1 alpha subcomplex subunit 6-like n=1 Tax=Tubulanus polymorphus TaxID=672921 RepID=UPI003DA54AF8
MASSAASALRQGVKQVKPILSTNKEDARRRVLNLYKAWYRQIPYVVMEYDVPITVQMGRDKIRAEFEKNRHVTDMRNIDLLVIKGQMDLVETKEIWKQKHHIMTFFKESQKPRPSDFLSKFYDGHEN